jgi:hypothetical protein
MGETKSETKSETKEMKKAFVLGTCRAFDITKKACRSNFLLLNRTGSLHHTTKEVLNAIDQQTRDKVPKKFKEYLNVSQLNIDQVKQADFIILEISSNKCIKFGGNYYKKVGSKFPEAKNNLYTITTGEILRDLKVISKKLDVPIIYVSHINILDKDGNPIIKAREQMANRIKTFIEMNGGYYFNPADHIGQDWMRYVDKPIYHYTDFGKKKVGAAFKKFISEEVYVKENW